ncbi:MULTISPECIES: FkbM family methyltransferase [unclassified Bradyrhizobium]|uniref:FkbM family methyltransferase n=1 Tax=unclassified Bradyrhizobium TaxID=2631580 RepID=UPI0030CED563
MRFTRLANGLEIAEINGDETKFLYDEIFVQEVYAAYDLRVPADGIVLDVGANIGMFSLYALQKFPGIRIYCFEPAPHCLERLRINTAPFGEAVRIFPTALGDTEGEVEFSYYPHYSIISGMFANEQQDLMVLRAGAATQYRERYGTRPSERELDLLVGSKLKGKQTFRCPITTLSRIMAAEGIGHVSLAKIDVERAENAILAGIDDADWPKIDQLVVEVHDQGNREHELMIDMLNRRGYQTSLFTEPTLKNSDIYVALAKRQLIR